MSLVKGANVPAIYSFRGDDVRVIPIQGQPWFVAADVCRVLEHTNTTVALADLDEDERAKESLGGSPVNVINEPGLYSLILRSRKPQAKQFKRWVTHEVIPSIRKTGSYVAGIPQTYSEALRALADEHEQRELAEARALELEPDAKRFLRYLNADGDYDVSQAVGVINRAGVEIGETRLWNYLRENGYTYRDSKGHHRVYQRWMTRGYFDLKPMGEWVNPDTGQTVLRAPQVRIKPEGIEMLVEKLTKELAFA